MVDLTCEILFYHMYPNTCRKSLKLGSHKFRSHLQSVQTVQPFKGSQKKNKISRMIQRRTTPCLVGSLAKLEICFKRADTGNRFLGIATHEIYFMLFLMMRRLDIVEVRTGNWYARRAQIIITS